MSIKHVAFVSTVFPWPIDTGKKVVLQGLLQYCTERLAPDNVHWILIGENHSPLDQRFDHAGYRLHHINGPSILSKLNQLLWRTLIKRDKSIQEALFFSQSVCIELQTCLDTINPDVVVFDTVRVAQLAYKGAQKWRNVLYLDDLFSVRYQRMVKQIDAGIVLGNSILGNFARFVPKYFRGIINNSGFIQRRLLELEGKRVAQSERTLPQFFNVSLLLNYEEAQFLSTQTHANIQIIRPWLQIEAKDRRSKNRDSSFVFLGALNLPHNETGLLQFLQTGFASFCDRAPNAKLIVIGRNPTERLLKEFAYWGPTRVDVRGFVPNLDALFGDCCGMVVPLIFGSGVKLKTLEALARGVPVVATSCGVEGIPMMHGRECFIENDMARFGIWMEKLLDRQVNEAMSAAATVLFRQDYSKAAVFSQYDRIFFSTDSADAGHSN